MQELDAREQRAAEAERELDRSVQDLLAARREVEGRAQVRPPIAPPPAAVRCQPRPLASPLSCEPRRACLDPAAVPLTRACSPTAAGFR